MRHYRTGSKRPVGSSMQLSCKRPIIWMFSYKNRKSVNPTNSPYGQSRIVPSFLARPTIPIAHSWQFHFTLCALWYWSKRLFEGFWEAQLQFSLFSLVDIHRVPPRSFIPLKYIRFKKCDTLDTMCRQTTVIQYHI